MVTISKNAAMAGGKSDESWIKDYREKHGDLYDYPNISYKSTQHFEVVCRIHGLFSITPSNHRSGKGCPSCANFNRHIKQVKTQNQIILDFINVHKNNYDYSLVEYLNAKTKVRIICRLHGEFSQRPYDHLNKKGCPKCARENHRGSWTTTSWETSAKNSRDFDYYKVYILNFFNEKEEFIKIGKTFRTIKKRMEGNNKVSYNYSEIKVFKFDSAKECSDFEIKLHTQFKKFKYVPLLKFGGMHECYKKESLYLLEDEVYDN